jgi:hypothetical protein
MEGKDIDEFAALVQRRDISGFSKLLYNLETAEIVREKFPTEVLVAEEAIDEWLGGLNEGDTIDLNIPPAAIWYNARLLKKEGNKLFHLHYLGWDKRRDETRNLSECRCLPAYTMTKQKRKNPPQPRKSFYVLEVVEEAPEAPPPLALLTATRSRRILDPPPNPTMEKEVEKKRPSPDDAPNLPGEGSTPKKLKKEKDLAEEADWICAECGDMEASDDSDLLLCEGGCKRSFHLLCLGITSSTERQRIISGEAWVCDDCRRHRHTCMICHDEGDDDTVRPSLCSALLTPSGGRQVWYGIVRQILPLRLPDLPGKALLHQAQGLTRPPALPLASLFLRQKQQTPSVSSSALVPAEDDDDKAASSAGGWGEYQLLSCPHHFCAVCSDFYRYQVPARTLSSSLTSADQLER